MPADMSRIPVDAGSIAYADHGPRDAPPIVLVHGIPTSSWLYRGIAPRLAAAGLRAVAPDLLGWGRSDKPAAPGAYTTRRQADRLAALLDHLAVPAATFVAHDAGGPWVFDLLDRAPERFAGLVVLNTTAYADAFTPPREVRSLAGPAGGPMLRLMGSRLGRPLVHRTVSRLTHAGRALPRTATEPHWLALHRGATRTLRAFARDLPDFMAQFPRYATALRRSTCPAMLVWGAADPVLRAERLVPRFTADLRLAPQDVHVLPDAGHFLQEDRPDDIADLIIAWMKDR